VIGGGAFAGLALALALRQGLGRDLPVIVADPALAMRPSRDPRASAIVAACRRLFEALGVWDDVAETAQPILDMVITDSQVEDATRPVFLTFSGEVDPGEPFAHMVENRHLIDALVRRADAEGVELRPLGVSGFETNEGGIRVAFSDGGHVDAALLVAADGARSQLRQRAGIATHGWDYDQSGIVVTVGHERDHEGRAEEHFLPAGPFAILPLRGRRSSLVWTEKRDEAARIIALPDEDFKAELEKRVGLHLGEVKPLDQPRAFPLGYFVARSFIAERLALVGFSQGTMMSLHVGLRRPARPFAIIGYSGVLAGAEALPPQAPDAPPILLVHGDADPMIPAEALFASAAALGRAGAAVQWHVSPGVGHGIDPAGLSLGGAFLALALRGQLARQGPISCAV